MVNKIITEKDFWTCTGGNVPAPLQSVQQSTKTKDGKNYITIVDTATSSYIDFGCNKLMLIMAIVAAVIAVAVVATGGAALIAVGAIAGAAGAAAGAVVGGLICGQIAKMARVWLGSKDNMIVQGKPAITSGNEMKCMLFGDKISHAPDIKNWWQAISLAGANYVGGILEGMMAGAAVGMGGAFISGGRAAFVEGGTPALSRAALELLKNMPKNFGVNAVESFGKFGLTLRGVMGAQNTAATYGTTGTATVGDFAAGTVAMETGAYDSFNNIKEGKGTWQDFVGMAMMVAPVGKGKRDLESEISKKADDAEGKKAEDEATKKAFNQEVDAPKEVAEFEAFEGEPLIQSDLIPEGTRRNSAGRLIDSKTGKFVDEPNSLSNTKKIAYKRNMSERKKALLRDANDPNSGLSDDARKYIKDNNGNKVPDKKYNKDYKGSDDYAVHHEEPLYTEKSLEGKKTLDKSDKMKTIPKQDHIDTHSYCGNTYHKFGPHQNHK
ncbi:hypothetical protein [[Flexibacter] sp. ATCC 35103]|uniref:hypothetical protein n=1 Tax=[Flexibacter] sp. ATCC 35103 TaxID=1937528 RepID=UPI0009CFCE90|nr:hypothetical protein [[Flexibacter] sp. ATCC 35103]OMQ07911.1 hypothetical protein BXU01_23045 [[Flexibacter] sp. ATCC 35103]